VDAGVLAVGLLIIVARIVDVSLGTMRTIAIVQGRALFAWVLGFFEVLIWLFAVAHVFHNLDRPTLAICYALGFATGSYVGIKLEGWFAFGKQVIRIFTRSSAATANGLREAGFRVTSFNGEGRGGPVQLLFIETSRRETWRLLAEAAKLDKDCYYLVDDIRLAAHPAMVRPMVTGWRSVLKRK